MIHRPRMKLGMMSNLYLLSEAQMQQLRPYIPKWPAAGFVDTKIRS